MLMHFHPLLTFKKKKNEWPVSCLMRHEFDLNHHFTITNYYYFSTTRRITDHQIQSTTTNWSNYLPETLLTKTQNLMFWSQLSRGELKRKLSSLKIEWTLLVSIGDGHQFSTGDHHPSKSSKSDLKKSPFRSLGQLK